MEKRNPRFEKFKISDNELVMVTRKAGELLADCTSHLMNYSLMKDAAAVFDGISKDYTSEFHTLVVDSLEKRKESLAWQYRGQGESTFIRAAVQSVAESANKSAGGFCDSERVEIYALALKALDGWQRKNYPQAGLLVDLMIKAVLLNEKDTEVREAAWERAGLKDKDTLMLKDISRR